MSDMAAGFPIIECENVSKAFDLSAGRTFFRSYLASRFRPGKPEVFQALRNVSFTVEPGESLAIVGANGAGKSTLLSLVAGVNSPSEGRIAVNGTVAALLELGAGFHPDLTARENVQLNAALLGLTRAELRERFDSIVEFSGVREFMEQPLRTFSSGMAMRLAFAVAVHVDPDILVIDEAFAVGDEHFARKCIDRIFAFKAARKTFVCVSHSTDVLRQLCEHAIWLDHGQVVLTGKTADVLDAYRTSSPGHVVSA